MRFYPIRSFQKKTTPYGPRYSLLPLGRQLKENDPTYEYQFVDVGSLSCGAVFGLGENLQHKTIVARTSVQCLLVPRYWLFIKAQNKGNIWERIRLYLDSTIPSRTLAFKEYLDELKWKKYRKDLVEAVMSNSRIPNPTTYFDIPLICRVYDV